MRFFSLFITRPIATTLLAIAILLLGMLSFRELPVSPLPKLDIPIIVVTASMPGASPNTMATSIATPLEQVLGRIAGINTMSSSSSLGNTLIVLEFAFGRDINGAARDVQAAINRAIPLLPSGMPAPPKYRKINPASSPIMILTLTSKQANAGQLYDIASTQLAQKISQIDGVGEVAVSGSSSPAIRVELKPDALFNQGVSLDAVRQAISNNNLRQPLGILDNQQHWQIQTNDQLNRADQYKPLIIQYNNGAAVRLEDVANVINSVQDSRNAGMTNGKPAVLLIIRRAADANIIATIDRIRQTLPDLQASIPSYVHLNIAQDRSPSIRASLAETERSLIISVLLVIAVVFLFLRSLRATLIPAAAIPIALIGSFIAIYLAGFSLNNLSLMALIVATGFVVDDAIVVLENIARHREQGMSPFQAAKQGMREVGFTVMAMSISLIAVFIPLLFLGGVAGSLFHEFAVSLTMAILLSLLISLTLTPMMCAHLLGNQKEGNTTTGWPQQLAQIIGNSIEKCRQAYGRSLHKALNYPKLILLLLLSIIAGSIYLYIDVPKTFFPEQDTGQISGGIQADQSISFQAMRSKLTDFMNIVKADPAVANVTGFTGGSRTNSGSMFISLKPLAERKISADQVINRLRSKLAHEPGARLYLMPVQDIRVGGRQANASYQYTLLSDDLAALKIWEPKIRAALSKLPQLTDLSSDREDKGQQTNLIYDRTTMQRLGITVEEVNQLLNNALGQQQISTIYQPLNQYKVVMEIDPQQAQDITVLNKLFVINDQGKAIPLSSFVHWQDSNAPLSINHQELSAASTLSFNLAPGYDLSDAVSAVEKAVVQLGVPSTVRGEFAGTAQDFQELLHEQVFLIAAAILTVYIVLGVLYESYLHPLTIISTIPSAGVGALFALLLFGIPFSLIALIGILLLIGLVKKNAIMMVDFAITAQREQQINAKEAIYQACLLRFRPIMMTTSAAILGALPLILTHGDGTEMRIPLGVTVVGGLLVSQLLTLYTTPVVYMMIDRLKRREYSMANVR